MLSDHCLSVMSVCLVSNVGVLWPNGWTDQGETWHTGRPRPCHIVLDGDPGSPPPKAHICCGQMARWIKMPLGTKVGLGPVRIVLHGDPAPPSQKGYSP